MYCCSNMNPVFARGNQRTLDRLLHLRRQALNDHVPRIAQRLHGIVLSLEGRRPPEIARLLKVHRSTVALWIEQFNQQGEQGLFEGLRPGRPVGLNPQQRETLGDILDSGPVAYGLETGIWTSPLIAQIIREEFGPDYHPGHVRKLLRKLGYSVQRPTTRLVQADQRQKRKWVRSTYPTPKKRPNRRGGHRF
jgi:transposase